MAKTPPGKRCVCSASQALAKCDRPLSSSRLASVMSRSSSSNVACAEPVGAGALFGRAAIPAEDTAGATAAGTGVLPVLGASAVLGSGGAAETLTG